MWYNRRPRVPDSTVQRLTYLLDGGFSCKFATRAPLGDTSPCFCHARFGGPGTQLPNASLRATNARMVVLPCAEAAHHPPPPALRARHWKCEHLGRVRTIRDRRLPPEDSPVHSRGVAERKQPREIKRDALDKNINTCHLALEQFWDMCMQTICVRPVCVKLPGWIVSVADLCAGLYTVRNLYTHYV